MRNIIIPILLFFTVACSGQNNSKKNDNLANGNARFEIPDEFKNTTWIPLDTSEPQSYIDILEYERERPYQCIKFEGDYIWLISNDFGDYGGLPVDSMFLEKNNTFTFIVAGGVLSSISINWKDKRRGITQWQVKYENFSGQGEEVHTSTRVEKRFVTPENFPIPKKAKVVIEEEKPLDLTVYSEVLEDLPLEGHFVCDNTEENFICSFKDGQLFLSNEDENIYEAGSHKIIEVIKNKAVITLTECLSIQCDVRKIKGSTNKYALFFRWFTEDTKYECPEFPYYSKTRPIAEIQIIDKNTIRKKWLGVYNRRTKKREDVEGYGWEEDDCTIIKK